MPPKPTPKRSKMGSISREGDDGMIERGPARNIRATPKYMAEHKVEAGETLSAISLKYYKSAVRDKWMIIYEANKETIGDNPGMIRPGMVLKIPELPK